jgi:hypothetical protein
MRRCPDALRGCYQTLDAVRELSGIDPTFIGDVQALKRHLRQLFDGVLDDAFDSTTEAIRKKLAEQGRHSLIDPYVEFFGVCRRVHAIFLRLRNDAAKSVANFAVCNHILLLADLVQFAQSLGVYEGQPLLEHAIAVANQQRSIQIVEAERRELLSFALFDVAEISGFTRHSFRNASEVVRRLESAIGDPRMPIVAAQLERIDRALSRFVRTQNRSLLVSVGGLLSEIDAPSPIIKSVVAAFENKFDRLCLLTQLAVFPFPSAPQREPSADKLAMLAEPAADADSLPRSAEAQAFADHCRELESGGFGRLLRRLSAETPESRLGAEFAEIRQLRARARATKAAPASAFTFEETLAVLQERHGAFNGRTRLPNRGQMIILSTDFEGFISLSDSESVLLASEKMIVPIVFFIGRLNIS